MKRTKNTSCLWRDTASLPRKSDWSFNYKKRTRPARKARKAEPVDAMPTVKPIQNLVIKGEVSLASLGLDYSGNATMVRTSIHA